MTIRMVGFGFSDSILKSSTQSSLLIPSKETSLTSSTKSPGSEIHVQDFDYETDFKNVD